MSRYWKYLKLGSTAFCLLATLLLCVLWVRSYWLCDIFETKTNSGIVHLESRRGVVIYQVIFYNFKPGWPAAMRAEVVKQLSLGRIHSSYPVAESYSFSGFKPFLGFGRFNSGATTIVFARDWFTVLFSAALAIIPWIPLRFSLRTLLIATTLIALMLGLAVYASR
jgi:hypothetical protein